MVSQLFQPIAVDPVPRLALTRLEACEALGISESTLDIWRSEYGLPFVKRGGVVLIPVNGLREWLAKNSQFVGQESENSGE